MSSTKTNNNFCSWVTGFAGAKNHYPEPWASADEDVFSTGRTLGEKIVSVKGSTTPVSNRVALGVVRAVNALASNRHTIAVHGTEVYVEYYSEKAETPRIACYDYATNTVSGCLLSTDTDGIEATFPLPFSSSSSGSGVPFFLAIALGRALRSLSMMTMGRVEDRDESIKKGLEIGTLLTSLAMVPREEQLVEENAVKFASLSDLVYNDLKALTSAGLNGLSDTGFVLRIELADLMANGSVSKAYGVQTFNVSSKCSDARTRKIIQAFVAPATAIPYASFTNPSPIFKFSDETPVDDGGPDVAAEKPAMDALCKELKLDIHPLSPEEMEMVPKLSPGYVVDEQLLDAARTIKADWKFPGLDLAPNFILEGDSGSGKTAATSFWAHVFGVPRTKITMNPLFESSNLIGAFYPVFSDVDDWDLNDKDKEVIGKVKVLLEKSEILAEGGVPKTTDVLKALRRAFSCDEVREIIREGYDIPTSDEIAFDPEGAWAMLGNEGETPVEEEITLAANKAFENRSFRLLNVLCEKAESGAVSYRFILSELMKAFKFGWLVEIQEAASVLRPGVLTELNSLLEPNGRIELPNGSYITRHPDTIVVITTNRDYAGNVDLNESLRDRCMFGLKMDLPPAAVMAERAMAQTGFTDRDVAVDAAKTIIAVNNEAKNANIKGSFGMRSLLAWMLDLRRGDFSEEAFTRRVIWKMTTRDDDVSLLKAAYQANCPFASAVRSGRRARA